MRITIKGGVWKNIEDEILKAAVMKYGKNQWARISSLLVRKSAKQCKARWYEWLDPSIKKTEWSREEEEKLLHLAKLMPCQWRSIAPIVGRTASQCMEHYNKLLDAAQQKDENYDPSDDPRRLRPGEIDPNPEGKPPRPDPVDMDEDEKEMLSEARARLANTKGKKAKRKAREKQLEEARRLASLQKRRELKAAGIDVEPRRRRIRGIDYNKEIPFHKKPPPGFFAPPPEEEMAPEPSFVNLRLDHMEGKRRSEDEDELRKQDNKRMKSLKEKNLPAAVLQINKLNDPEQVRRRSKLALPEPQISERELEEISKMEGASAAAAEIDQGDDADAPTRNLIANYNQTPVLPTPTRTPLRTPARVDTVLLESQNLIALTNAATPLAGGENAPLHPTDFSGVTPRREAVQTPNLLATPLRTPGRTGGGGGGGTGSNTPSRTPLRDGLNINEDGALQAANAREERQRQSALRKTIISQLSQLPAPKNEYRITMPDMPDDIDDDKPPTLEEDQADVDMRQRLLLDENEKKRLRTRSTPLRRNLPRPMVLPARPPPLEPGVRASEEDKIEHLVREELYHVLLHDWLCFPLNPAEPPQPPQDHWHDYSDKELDQATALVQEELLTLHEYNALKELPHDVFAQVWDSAVADLVYASEEKKLLRASKASPQQVLHARQVEFQTILANMKRESQRAQKLEKKLNVYNGGYMNRATALLTQVAETHSQVDQSYTELLCFKALRQGEMAAIQSRVSKGREDVEQQTQREVRLQMKYANLITEREDLKQQLLSASTAGASAAGPSMAED